MKNLFITGGLGQDGQILTDIILSKNKFRVFILSKKKNSFKRKKVKYIYSNLLNKKKLEKIFEKYIPDTIVHLAANNPAFNEKSKKLFYLDNLISSKNIFYSSVKFNQKVKIIFANSAQIFKKKIGTVNERSAISKKDDYTKFRIDYINFLKNKKVNYVNVILFNHDSRLRNSKFLLPRLTRAIKSKNINFIKKILLLNLYGDFSHAEDICHALYKIISTKKNIKNIILSSNKCISINNLIHLILKKNQIFLNINFSIKKKKSCLKGNNSYAMKILNWKPRKNILTAFQEIYDKA